MAANPHLQATFDPETVQPPSGAVFDLVPVTPSDSAEVAPHRCLYVAAGGDLSFVTRTGATRTVTLAAGWHPLIVARVRATGTTATGIALGI